MKKDLISDNFALCLRAKLNSRAQKLHLKDLMKVRKIWLNLLIILPIKNPLEEIGNDNYQNPKSSKILFEF